METFILAPYPWITPFYKEAIKVYHFKYSHFPHYGLQIISTPAGLPYFAKSGKSAVYFIIINILVLLLGYIILLHKILTPKQSISANDIVENGIVFLFVKWLLVVCILARLETYRDTIDFSNGINHVTLANSQTRIPQSFLKDIPGLVIVNHVIFISVFGTMMPYVLRFLHCDFWYIIFKDLGFNLDNWIIWSISLTLSIVYYDLITLRDMVTEVLLSYAVFMSVDGHLSAISATSTSSRQSHIQVKAYKQLVIAYNRIAPASNNIFLYSIVFSLIALTEFFWIALKYFNVIPFILFITFMDGFVVGLALILNLMEFAANIRCKSGNIIERNLKQLKIYGRRRNELVVRMWKAQQPIPINCGEKFAITHDAVMNYLRVLTDIITNVLLLF